MKTFLLLLLVLGVSLIPAEPNERQVDEIMLWMGINEISDEYSAQYSLVYKNQTITKIKIDHIAIENEAEYIVLFYSVVEHGYYHLALGLAHIKGSSLKSGLTVENLSSNDGKIISEYCEEDSAYIQSNTFVGDLELTAYVFKQKGEIKNYKTVPCETQFGNDYTIRLKNTIEKLEIPDDSLDKENLIGGNDFYWRFNIDH